MASFDGSMTLQPWTGSPASSNLEIGGGGSSPTQKPISTATNKAGKPIRVGFGPAAIVFAR